MNFFRKIIDKIWIWICHNELDIFLVISSPFLSSLVTSFSIGTVKVLYFSVFSPKQVNCFFKLFFYDKMIIIVRSIMKNYRNFFRYTIFQITYGIHSTSIFPYIMTMISNFTIFFISQIFILKFFFTNITDFCIPIWFLLLFC